MKNSFVLLLCSLFLFHTPQSHAAECSPIRLGDQTILCMRDGIGSISASERAQSIQHRIQKLADDFTTHPELINVVENEGLNSIVVNDIVLLSLSAKDMEPGTSQTLPEFAKASAESIKSAITSYRKDHSLEVILFGALYALLATIGLILAIIFVGKLRLWIIGKLDTYSSKHLKKLKSTKVLNLDRVIVLLAALITGIKNVFLFFLFYLYVSLVFSFFPWTKQLTPQILNYILDPLHKIMRVLIDYIPNVFFIAIILTITFYALKVVKVLFNEIENGNISLSGFHRDWAQPTFQLIRILFYALSLVMIFPYLPGSSSPAFQGLSVFLGVLISFGSGSAISNLIAGVVLTYMRPFRIGDRVKIADTMGDVIERNFLITRVKTIKHADITIPNSMVLGSHIINYSSSASEQGMILNTTITIGYDAPWRTVHELLIKAAKKTDLIDTEKTPFVLQTALNDFYVSYEINAYTKHAGKMAKIYSDLHQNIQDTFNEGGVEIMSPHYQALRDGDASTIPTLK